jgi:O-antigen/teichoic acid export membrane protein
MLRAKVFSAYKNNSFKTGTLFSLFSVLNNGLNFLLIFGLSIYLSKADFGRINLFLIYVMVVSNIISLGTESFFAVNYFNFHKIRLRKILSAIIYITSSISILLLLLSYFIGSDYILKYTLGRNILYATICICFFQFFQTMLLEIFRLEEKVWRYGMITLAWVTLNLILTFVILFNTDLSYKSRIYAHLISASIMFLLSVSILCRKRYLSLSLPSVSLIKKCLNYGLPLLPHNSTTWLRSGMDRYFISFFFNASLLGVYSFAYNLSGVLLMIGTAFNAINSVYIYKTLSNKDDGTGDIEQQIKFMIKFYFLIALFGYIASIVTIYVFIPKYLDSISLLAPFFIAALFQCYYYLFVNFILYYKQTRKLMYITFSISVVHAILSFFLTRYSIFYTAYLHLISNVVICILIYLLSLRYIPNFKGIFFKKLSI